MTTLNTKHSPGPWKARPLSVCNDGTQDAPDGLGWEIEGPPEPQLRGQFAKAADAYLVAAAPELYRLIQEIELLIRVAQFPLESPANQWIIRAALEEAEETDTAIAKIIQKWKKLIYSNQVFNRLVELEPRVHAVINKVEHRFEDRGKEGHES